MDGLQHMAKAGIEQARHRHQGQHHNAQGDVIEDAVIGEIQPKAQGRATCQREAVISAVDLQRSHQIKQHLGKGQRDHDEIHPLGA